MSSDRNRPRLWDATTELASSLQKRLPEAWQERLNAGARQVQQGLHRLSATELPAPVAKVVSSVLRRQLDDGERPASYFTKVYVGNLWRGESSRSGPGSEGAFAEQKIDLLQDLIERHGVRSILDIGCGDFFWMQRIAGAVDRYHGIDVVEPLIERNRERFASKSVTFECVDLTADGARSEVEGEPFDLVVCFDVIGHLLNPEVDRLLDFVISRSGAKLFLVTNRRDENSELYLSRPKTRHEGINVQKHPIFVERDLAPIWKKNAEYPGDVFELYPLREEARVSSSDDGQRADQRA